MEFFNQKKRKTTKVLGKKSPIKQVQSAKKPGLTVNTFTKADKRRLRRGRTRTNSTLSL